MAGMKILYEAVGDGYGHAIRACLYAESRPGDAFDIVVSHEAIAVVGGSARPANVRLLAESCERNAADYDDVVMDTWAAPRAGLKISPNQSVTVMRRIRAGEFAPDMFDVHRAIVPGRFDVTANHGAEIWNPIPQMAERMAEMTKPDRARKVALALSGGKQLDAQNRQLQRLMRNYQDYDILNGEGGWAKMAHYKIVIGSLGWATYYAAIAAGCWLIGIPHCPEQIARHANFLESLPAAGTPSPTVCENVEQIISKLAALGV